MQSRTSLRQQLRQLRQQLNRSALKQREQQLCRRLLSLPHLKNAQHIAAYWPADGEISPLSALRQWQQSGKNTCLPAVQPSQQMHFLPFTAGTGLRKNRYGIPEPATRRRIAPQQLDAVLLPLVAFDAHGNRLGMGGGYYDRAFAFRNVQRWRKKPLLIGLAHDFQQIRQLPCENWDIPLDMIVTNRQTFRRKPATL